MRVLICDDEPPIRLLYRTAFEEEGAEVVEAIDGDDCLATADANPPDSWCSTSTYRTGTGWRRSPS